MMSDDVDAIHDKDQFFVIQEMDPGSFKPYVKN